MHILHTVQFDSRIWFPFDSKTSFARPCFRDWLIFCSLTRDGDKFILRVEQQFRRHRGNFKFLAAPEKKKKKKSFANLLMHFVKENQNSTWQLPVRGITW